MPLCAVLPTHRPENFAAWLEAWRPLFSKHHVKLFVIEDHPEPSIKLPELDFPAVVYTRADIPDFIPTGTGSCRSYGFLRAYQEGYDVITLDDDCRPEGDLIEAYTAAWRQLWPVSNYFDVGHSFGLDEYMRGYPFSDRDKNKALIQYGGWDNVPDLDAVTQAQHEKHGPVEGYKFDRRTLAIPTGVGFTGCIMNVAIKHEAIPLMYQLIMGNDRVGYDRWDDIWSGLFAKKICDHLGIPILINGNASIIHTRASDTATNLQKEQGGYLLNEFLWEKLQGIELEGRDIISCYDELASIMPARWFGDNGDKIIRGMFAWVDALSSR